VYPGSRPLSYITVYRWDGYFLSLSFLFSHSLSPSETQSTAFIILGKTELTKRWKGSDPVRLSLICHSQFVFLCLLGSFRSCTCMTFGFLSQMLLQNAESSFQSPDTGWQLQKSLKKKKKEKHRRSLDISLWLDHYCCDYYVIYLATVLLTLIDGVCCFSFLKQSYRKTHHSHIPGWQCQGSSGSNCERMVGRMAWRIIFTQDLDLSWRK